MKHIISAAFAFLILMTACRFTADLPPAPAPDAETTPSPIPPESQPRAESTEPILNIHYSDEPASRDELLSLDVYPLTGNDNPVLIFVHGGGWVRGDKSSVNAKPAAFNTHGFIFVSVNYRLSPRSGYRSTSDGCGARRCLGKTKHPSLWRRRLAPVPDGTFRWRASRLVARHRQILFANRRVGTSGSRGDRLARYTSL